MYEMKYLLILLPFMWGCAFGQIPIKNERKTPCKKDTSYGVLIWYDQHLLVRADSCVIYSERCDRGAFLHKGTIYYSDSQSELIIFIPKIKKYVTEKQVIKFIE